MRMELVEDAVERVFGQAAEAGAENVGQRGAADPGRRGMLGSGFDQPVEDAGAGELARAVGQADIAQDVAEAETVPELVAGMDGTRLAMLLGGNPARIDGDIPVISGGWGWCG